MTLGQRLVYARENKGYKQNEFAEMLKITATRLNYWEKDKREPDVEMIKKITKLLGISSDWLIGNEQTAKNEDQKKERLIKNYELLNDEGKEDLLDSSDMLASNPRKLKEDNQIVQGLKNA